VLKSDTRRLDPRIVFFVPHIEDRKRKDGTVTYYVRWIDPDSKQRMAQKMPSHDSAKLLLTVLKAHATTSTEHWRASRLTIGASTQCPA